MQRSKIRPPSVSSSYPVCLVCRVVLFVVFVGFVVFVCLICLHLPRERKTMRKNHDNHWNPNLVSDAQTQLKTCTDLCKNTQRILSATREQERPVRIPTLAFFANYQDEFALERRNTGTIHDFLW